MELVKIVASKCCWKQFVCSSFNLFLVLSEITAQGDICLPYQFGNISFRSLLFFVASRTFSPHVHFPALYEFIVILVLKYTAYIKNETMEETSFNCRLK